MSGGSLPLLILEFRQSGSVNPGKPTDAALGARRNFLGAVMAKRKFLICNRGIPYQMVTALSNNPASCSR